MDGNNDIPISFWGGECLGGERLVVKAPAKKNRIRNANSMALRIFRFWS